MKKALALSLSMILFFSSQIKVTASGEDTGKTQTTAVGETVSAVSDAAVAAQFEVDCRSAVLMEAGTGTVLFSKNEKTSYPPASVTKIMTLLLFFEALDAGQFSLSDKVRISESAAAMGGSQVFLKEDEEITVEELLKCTVIASANDAAYALAELVAGSEEVFVDRMNKRAEELGLTGTHFENVTGLDDTVRNHVCSAIDIAMMSRELLRHEKVLEYSSLWQDSIRDGAFTLTNTNRLVRFYEGCNGLKTGSTASAGYCVSATAKRGGMQLIAVVMGADTRDSRNKIARTMLDYGFSNYAIYTSEERMLERAPVCGGIFDETELYEEKFSALVCKGRETQIRKEFDIPETVKAPFAAGDKLGEVRYYDGENLLGTGKIFAKTECPAITFFDLFLRVLRCFVTQSKK